MMPHECSARRVCNAYATSSSEFGKGDESVKFFFKLQKNNKMGNWTSSRREEERKVLEELVKEYVRMASAAYNAAMHFNRIVGNANSNHFAYKKAFYYALFDQWCAERAYAFVEGIVKNADVKKLPLNAMKRLETVIVPPDTIRAEWETIADSAATEWFDSHQQTIPPKVAEFLERWPRLHAKRSKPNWLVSAESYVTHGLP